MTVIELATPEENRNAQWSTLARQAQGGDKRAYATLLREILPYIRSILAGGLANQDWIDDIAQDVLVSVHKSLSTYSPDMPFHPWLRAIVQFRRTDFLRKHYKNRDLKDGVQSNAEIFGHSVTNPTSAGELKDIQNALDDLPAKQKQIIEKIKIQGYSTKEVADQMGMTDSAVKVSVHRAINKLKDKLG